MVRHREEGTVYALKTMSKKKLQKAMKVDQAKRERKILARIEHPFIVSLRYAFQTESKLFMVYYR